MHFRRLRKKVEYLVYFTAFWGVLAGIIWLAVVGLPEPPPEGPGESIVTHQDIVLESVDVVSHGDTVDVVAQLRNPNADVGIVSLPVTFVMKNATGDEVARVDRSTYILPGSIQYVLVAGVETASPVTVVTAELPKDVEFVGLPAGRELPNLATFPRQRQQRTIGTTNVEEHVGVVSNSSNLNFARVDIVGIAMDSTGQVVGVAETFVGELVIGEQREFTLIYPEPAHETTSVLTLASTNLFVEENVLPTVGDPTQLR